MVLKYSIVMASTLWHQQHCLQWHQHYNMSNSISVITMASDSVMVPAMVALASLSCLWCWQTCWHYGIRNSLVYRSSNNACYGTDIMAQIALSALCLHLSPLWHCNVTVITAPKTAFALWFKQVIKINDNLSTVLQSQLINGNAMFVTTIAENNISPFCLHQHIWWYSAVLKWCIFHSFNQRWKFEKKRTLIAHSRKEFFITIKVGPRDLSWFVQISQCV